MNKLKQTHLPKITRLRRIKYWPDLIEILKIFRVRKENKTKTSTKHKSVKPAQAKKLPWRIEQGL